MKNKAHLHIRALCEGAILVALAFVLSFIKLYTLPNGGSLTPAMFPLLLFALRWGLSRGLAAGFVFGLLQLLLDGAYAWSWQCMILDYLCAYTMLGIGGFFRGKSWGIFASVVAGGLGRLLFHFISGATIYRIVAPEEILHFGTFSNPELYSLVYNATYLVPCIALALAVAGVLYVPLKKYMTAQDLK